ncbi:Holliday junction resolvase RuvX [Halonatronum saccharophilum]|uniref:Holliday junction resolvase RuvX n=1 Tax=Halonatronum saccharophilum TaxID=150060 RepID=UPI0004891117|nr:Holliday junction resolvase RuvX [Halonatronum saccharophilum]
MLRIMGLDLGDKRTGVAVSDRMGWTAQGKEVIEVKSVEEDIEYIIELVAKYEAEKVVVGLPKNMDGSLGPRANKVLDFVEKLKEKVDIPVVTWDERLSTVAVERTLISADVSRKKRKKVIDKMAAVIILQNYLDSQ